MSILINILSTFNSKGLTAAEKRTAIFNKTLKSLGVTMAATFGARRITQFAKESIKAFAEEDKAIRALSLNLKSLGLAYNVTPIEDYIDRLQRATGISDNELRPAFQQLANATRDIAAAQDILNTALDISSGTGKSLSQVTQALTRAYLGNKTSLGRLNLGITKADLATKKFDDILKDLSTRFKGQAAVAADTYIGKINRLNIAADEAQELLGEKLVTAIDMLGGDRGGMTVLADEMERAAESAGNIVLAFAIVAKQMEDLTGGKVKASTFSPLGLLNLGSNVNLGAKAIKLLVDASNKIVKNEEKKGLINQTAVAHQTDLARLAKQVEKATKNTVTELTKKQKLELASKALIKSGDVMDLDKIQLEAASQGKLTENEKLRVEYMKQRLQLEDAIAAKEATRALALANQLTTLEDKISAFKPASPFDAWEDSILRMQNGLYNLGISEKKGSPGSLGTASAVTPEMSVFGGSPLITPGAGGGAPGNAPTINVNVTANDFLSQEAKQAVVDAVVEASSTGIATNWFRTTGRANMAI